MSGFKLPVLLAVAVGSAALVTVPTADAAVSESWSDISTLSSPESGPADIAVSQDGARATAVWTRWDGSAGVVESASAVVVAGVATWGPVGEVSDPGTAVGNPSVALSDDGSTAVVVWQDNSGLGVVRAAVGSVESVSASWGTPGDVNAAGGAAVDAPLITLSDDGSLATAVWQGANRTESASASVAGTTAVWGDVSLLGPVGEISKQPDLAASADGQLVAAVWSRSDGAHFRVQSASARVNSHGVQDWGSVTTLSAGGSDADQPALDLSQDGTSMTAVWHRNQVVQSASGFVAEPTTQTWGSVATVQSGGLPTPDPEVAVSADGSRAVTVWLGGAQNLASRVASVSSTTQSWGDVAALASATATDPHIRLSADGVQVASAWTQYSTGYIVSAASGTVSGNVVTWEEPQRRSPALLHAEAPALGLSDDGARATLVWRLGAVGSVIQSATGSLVPSGISAPPGPPMLPHATPGNGRATLTFTVPADRGSAITDYEYSVDGGTWTSAGSAAVPVTVPGLVNDTAVSLRVRAVNGNGPGLPSDAVSVTPELPAPVPGVLSWMPPPWASPATQYKVRYRPLESGSWDTYAARSTPWPGALPTQVRLDAEVGDCGAINSAAGWDSCPLQAGPLVAGGVYEFSIEVITGTGSSAVSEAAQYLVPTAGETGATTQIPGWGADPDPTADPTPTTSPSPDPTTGPRPDPRRATIRKLRITRTVARWKAPLTAPTARFQIRMKRAEWRAWRGVGRRTEVRAGPKVKAVKVRAVLPAGKGPVALARRKR